MRFTEELTPPPAPSTLLPAPPAPTVAPAPPVPSVPIGAPPPSGSLPTRTQGGGSGGITPAPPFAPASLLTPPAPAFIGPAPPQPAPAVTPRIQYEAPKAATGRGSGGGVVTGDTDCGVFTRPAVAALVETPATLSNVVISWNLHGAYGGSNVRTVPFKVAALERMLSTTLAAAVAVQELPPRDIGAFLSEVSKYEKLSSFCWGWVNIGTDELGLFGWDNRRFHHAGPPVPLGSMPVRRSGDLFRRAPAVLLLHNVQNQSLLALVSVHLKAELKTARTELEACGPVAEAVQNAVGKVARVVFLGDFNVGLKHENTSGDMHPGEAWAPLAKQGIFPFPLNPSVQSTNVWQFNKGGERRLYDHIATNGVFLAEVVRWEPVERLHAQFVSLVAGSGEPDDVLRKRLKMEVYDGFSDHFAVKAMLTPPLILQPGDPSTAYENLIALHRLAPLKSPMEMQAGA